MAYMREEGEGSCLEAEGYLTTFSLDPEPEESSPLGRGPERGGAR